MRIKQAVENLQSTQFANLQEVELSLKGDDYADDNDEQITLTRLTSLLSNKRNLRSLTIIDVSRNEAIAIRDSFKSIASPSLVLLRLENTNPEATTILLRLFYVNLKKSGYFTLKNLDKVAMAQVIPAFEFMKKLNAASELNQQPKLNLVLLNLQREPLQVLIDGMKKNQISVGSDIKIDFALNTDIRTLFNEMWNSSRDDLAISNNGEPPKELLGASITIADDNEDSTSEATLVDSGSSDSEDSDHEISDEIVKLIGRKRRLLTDRPATEVKKAPDNIESEPSSKPEPKKATFEIQELVVALADFKLKNRVYSSPISNCIPLDFPIPKGWNRHDCVQFINEQTKSRFLPNISYPDEPKGMVRFIRNSLCLLNERLGERADAYNRERMSKQSQNSGSVVSRPSSASKNTPAAVSSSSSASNNTPAAVSSSSSASKNTPAAVSSSSSASSAAALRAVPSSSNASKADIAAMSSSSSFASTAGKATIDPSASSQNPTSFPFRALATPLPKPAASMAAAMQAKGGSEGSLAQTPTYVYQPNFSSKPIASKPASSSTSSRVPGTGASKPASAMVPGTSTSKPAGQIVGPSPKVQAPSTLSSSRPLGHVGSSSAASLISASSSATSISGLSSTSSIISSIIPAYSAPSLLSSSAAERPGPTASTPLVRSASTSAPSSANVVSSSSYQASSSMAPPVATSNSPRVSSVPQSFLGPSPTQFEKALLSKSPHLQELAERLKKLEAENTIKKAEIEKEEKLLEDGLVARIQAKIEQEEARKQELATRQEQLAAERQRIETVDLDTLMDVDVQPGLGPRN